MGQKDSAEKTLEAHNDVFADIVNALLCKGKQVILPQALFDAQSFSQYKAEDGTLHGQERDVAKYWQNSAIQIALIGFENQTSADKDMPLRAISYDGAAYRSQVHRKDSDSRFPVLTIVLYFGTEQRWTSPRSLKERLTIPPALAPFINDYKLHVFELAWLSDEQINSFTSDFKLVAEYLRAKRTGAVQDWEIQKLNHVHEIIDLLRVISDDDIFLRMEDGIRQTQQEKGGVNVCDFVQRMKHEGIVLGRNEGIALGRREGIALGRDNLLSLFSKLYAAGRGADVQRATTDRAYLQQLLDEHERSTRASQT